MKKNRKQNKLKKNKHIKYYTFLKRCRMYKYLKDNKEDSKKRCYLTIKLQCRKKKVNIINRNVFESK